MTSWIGSVDVDPPKDDLKFPSLGVDGIRGSHYNRRVPYEIIQFSFPDIVRLRDDLFRLRAEG